MRNVKIKKWIPIEYTEEKGTTLRIRVKGTGCWEEDYSIDGKFHQWGNAYEEFEAGAGNYTVGIIELPNGEITEALTTNIKFVE